MAQYRHTVSVFALALPLLFSLSAAAECDDRLPTLPEMLSQPVGKKVMAVVKGTLMSGALPESEYLVALFQVEKSFGLAIPRGRYRVVEASNWGRDCIYYQEKLVPAQGGENRRPAYLVLTRWHGKTLVTPASAGEGMTQAGTMIRYVPPDDAGKALEISAREFEQRVLTGIPLSAWHRAE